MVYTFYHSHPQRFWTISEWPVTNNLNIPSSSTSMPIALPLGFAIS